MTDARREQYFEAYQRILSGKVEDRYLTVGDVREELSFLGVKSFESFFVGRLLEDQENFSRNQLDRHTLSLRKVFVLLEESDCSDYIASLIGIRLVAAFQKEEVEKPEPVSKPEMKPRDRWMFLSTFAAEVVVIVVMISGSLTPLQGFGAFLAMIILFFLMAFQLHRISQDAQEEN